MTAKNKSILYVSIIFFVTYLVVRFILSSFFDINVYVLSAISAAITVVLSPQRRVVKKQSGDEVQLKWLFSKKVIVLK